MASPARKDNQTGKRTASVSLLDWQSTLMDLVSSICTYGDIDEMLYKRNDEQNLDFIAEEDKFLRRTPLTCAVWKFNPDFLELLLFHGANVDFQDGEGATPLMRAAWLGNTAACALLLQHGADPHFTTSKWKAALYYAVSCRQIDTVELFLKHEAVMYDLSTLWTDKTDVESLIGASIERHSASILELFLKHCDKRHLILPLELLFIRCVELESEECAILILQQGHYPRQSSSDMSLFHKSAMCGLHKLMGFLVELNPQFMQEEWLTQKLLPPQTAQHVEFASWLNEYRKQPASLIKLCKSSIIAQLDTYYMLKIDELPLPKSLKALLKVVGSVFNALYTINI